MQSSRDDRRLPGFFPEGWVSWASLGPTSLVTGVAESEPWEEQRTSSVMRTKARVAPRSSWASWGRVTAAVGGGGGLSRQRGTWGFL